jgi:Kef-type K+ transport system membrane component KefB/voltage-gated potassium channel Kch
MQFSCTTEPSQDLYSLWSEGAFMAGLAGPIIDFGILIIGAMVLGGVALVFRQPVVLAYIAAGVIFGSQGLGFIGDEQYLYDIASELGIAMLLFVIGMELSFKKMLEVRRVVTFGVLAQSFLFVIIGMFAGYFLGFTLIESIYLGLVIAFASTLFIVKTLSEKHQLDTLHGRIMMGSLVFEDILVIVAISVLGVLAGAEPTGFVNWVINLPGLNLVPYIENIALVFGSLLLFGIAYLLNRFVARRLLKAFSHNAELLFVSALGFCFVLAFLAAEVGLSVAIGAFMAGMIVANTDYYLDLLGRIKTIATFFSLLFFATLGFKVTFANFTSLLVPILVISLIVMVLKPLIIGFMIRLFGYGKRTAILTALHMSQVSEFGLILITFGIKFGHVRPELLTITILVLLVTFISSSYYAKYAHGLTQWLQRRFPRLQSESDPVAEVALKNATTVLYGVEHLDEQFLKQVEKSRGGVLVVDPDPDQLEFARERNLATLTGSLSNEEVLEKLPLETLELVISTIPDFEENLELVEHLHKHNPKVTVVVSTLSMRDALTLYKHGASYVYVASIMDDAVVQQILEGANSIRLEAARKAHIERLKSIVTRRATAVDIDEFLSRVTQNQFAAVGGVFRRSGEEVDNVLKKLKGKK